MYDPIRLHGWQQLAEELLETLGDDVHDRGAPTWLRVFDDGEGGFSVDATGVPQALFGWTAPPECEAVGVVATGRLRADPFAAGDCGGDPAGEEPRYGGVCEDLAAVAGTRVRMCCVVARSGEVGWRLEGPGGVSSTSAPEAGRLIDCLKRCLGLRTPPAADGASELHGAAWAASVLEAAVEAPKALTWSDVTRLHPLARLLAGELAEHPGGSRCAAGRPDDLADLIRIAANAWSWAEMREQAAAGNLAGLIDARIAAWMDDGMFSRWLLSLVPPTGQLLGAVRGYLAPSAADRFEEALAPGP